MIRGTLVLFAVVSVYLYSKLCSAFRGKWWRRFCVSWFIFWGLLVMASRMKLLRPGRAFEILTALSSTWIAIAGIAGMGFLLMDMGSLAARWALADPHWLPWKRFFDPRKRVFAALFLIAAVVLYSFHEAGNVRRVDLVLEMPKLPEGVERLRLVHLTDAHIGGVSTLKRFRKIMDIVRSAEPDLLLITGDLVDGDMSFREGELELLAAHGAKHGAFAVTGNHEFSTGIGQAEAFMKRAGLVLLRGERRDVAGVTLIGLDDPMRFGEYADNERVPDGLVFPENRVVLLLKHRPRVIEGTEGKFDLQLSGHTHGGQIWPYRYVVEWMNRSVPRLSYRGGSAVYVSNGAGGIPLRFLAPPEVAVIDLVRRKKPELF